MQEAQEQREEDAVRGIVDDLGRRRPHVEDAQVGQQEGEQDEERHDGGDARVLQLADVPLVQHLQLVVLEAVRVDEAAEDAGRRHRLHAVIHLRRILREIGAEELEITSFSVSFYASVP